MKTIRFLKIVMLLAFILISCKKGKKEPEPVELSVTNITTSTVALAWTKNDDKDFAYYSIHRSCLPGVDTTSIKAVKITNQNDTTFDDDGICPHYHYYYKVYVFDAELYASASNEDSAAIPGLANLTIGINPAKAIIAKGCSFIVNIWIEAVTDLFGTSFEIAYDNTKIIADSAGAGDFLGNDVIFFQHYDSSVVSIAVTRKAGSGCMSGFGTLAKIYFHAISIGTTNIDFTSDLALNKENGNPVENFLNLAKRTSTIIVE